MEIEPPAYAVNARVASRSAAAVLAVDLGEVHLSRVTQVVVGWFRAAFQQSLVIADLTERGLASSAAPNRRLFAEVAVRLHWLSSLSTEDRKIAVDTMLNHERKTTLSTLKHLFDMGLRADFDPTEMNEFGLEFIDSGSLREQAKNFTEAARSMGAKNAAIFGIWRQESAFAHASGSLAGQLAPAVGNTRMGSGQQPVTDPDLEAHRIIQMLIVTVVGRLLAEEGVPTHLANAPAAAFIVVSGKL